MAYRTTPEATKGMPSGVPYIIGNEAAERFSFYGMKTILFIFMTEGLVNKSGAADTMDSSTANFWFHFFVFAVYFLPVFGAILADVFLGKYRTIFWLSIVYCLGHLALALGETRAHLATGLALISIGSGGIKPCVSANVGDQFGPLNRGLIARVYSWFYFAINFGSFFSTWLTPHLREAYGFQVAFAVPGVFMLLAAIIFWMGRNRYVHVPPGGWKTVREMFDGESSRALLNLVSIYAFVTMFWMIFDQTGSSWIKQAKSMDRMLLGREILPDEIQAVNPILIMLLIPLFTYVIYPGVNRFFTLTPLRKISIGFFFTAAAFAISARIEEWIVAGLHPSIVWQLVAYVILTMAEVMVSITSLEFAYTQAPKKLKSAVMAISLLAVAFGNAITMLVNYWNKVGEGKTRLSGPGYYWLFTGAMLVTSIAFVIRARFYTPHEYVQGEVEPAPDAA